MIGILLKSDAAVDVQCILIDAKHLISAAETSL